MPAETTSPGRDTLYPDQEIAVWSRSGSQARRIAAALGRELLEQPRHTRVDSSMKIAARFGVNNSTAVRARRFLVGAKIIYRSDADRHYYVA
jgi:DNA-binding GntR family transcriptional regulator